MAQLEKLFELVFQGPIDQHEETLRRLKGALISDFEMSVEQVKKLLEQPPQVIRVAEEEDALIRSFRLIQEAGGRVLIVRPSDVEQENNAPAEGPSEAVDQEQRTVTDERTENEVPGEPEAEEEDGFELIFDLGEDLSINPAEEKSKRPTKVYALDFNPDEEIDKEPLALLEEKEVLASAGISLDALSEIAGVPIIEGNAEIPLRNSLSFDDSAEEFTEHLKTAQTREAHLEDPSPDSRVKIEGSHLTTEPLPAEPGLQFDDSQDGTGEVPSPRFMQEDMPLLTPPTLLTPSEPPATIAFEDEDDLLEAAVENTPFTKETTGSLSIESTKPVERERLVRAEHSSKFHEEFEEELEQTDGYYEQTVGQSVSAPRPLAVTSSASSGSGSKLPLYILLALLLVGGNGFLIYKNFFEYSDGGISEDAVDSMIASATAAAAKKIAVKKKELHEAESKPIPFEFRELKGEFESAVGRVDWKLVARGNVLVAGDFKFFALKPPELTKEEVVRGVPVRPWLEKVEIFGLRFFPFGDGIYQGSVNAKAYIERGSDRFRLVPRATVRGNYDPSLDYFEGRLTLELDWSDPSKEEPTQTLHIKSLAGDSFQIFVSTEFRNKERPLSEIPVEIIRPLSVLELTRPTSGLAPSKRRISPSKREPDETQRWEEIEGLKNLL